MLFYVSGETVPDDADHPDTFVMRVQVTALCSLKTFWNRNHQQLVVTSQKTRIVNTELLCAVTPHCAANVWYEERMWTADHISTDTKHFMSKMCFQLEVWN